MADDGTERIDEASSMLKYLKSKWKDPAPCPMCGHTEWGVESKIFTLPLFGAFAFGSHATVLPVVPVICKNCGYMLLVSAVVAGLVEGERDEETERAAAAEGAAAGAAAAAAAREAGATPLTKAVDENRKADGEGGEAHE